MTPSSASVLDGVMRRCAVFLLLGAAACTSGAGEAPAFGECRSLSDPCAAGASCGRADFCGLGSTYECEEGRWIQVPRECPSGPAKGTGCGREIKRPGTACAAGSGPCDYGCDPASTGDRVVRVECLDGVWTLSDCRCPSSPPSGACGFFGATLCAYPSGCPTKPLVLECLFGTWKRTSPTCATDAGSD